MPNVMVALPNIGGALCSTPQSLMADAAYLTAVHFYLQRSPILMKLGHKDPTMSWFGRDHNGPDRPQRDRATPF